MGYIFDAWLEQGAPRLRIINPQNGSVSLSWDCPDFSTPDDTACRREIQTLFNRLLLLASAQDDYRQHLTLTKSSRPRGHRHEHQD